MAIDFDRLWDPKLPGEPGVSDDDIAEWEARHSVKLPNALAEALRRQNGGLVRYSEVRIWPLDEITGSDTSLLGRIAPADEGMPDRKLVFSFAEDERDEGPGYVLNFNANGPSGEPSVHVHNPDPPEYSLAAKTVEEFLAGLMAVSKRPGVDWSETRRLDVVLHHEKVSTMGLIRREIVLGRLDGALVLYTHDVAPDIHTYTKSTIPEPFNPWFAFIFKLPPFIGMPYFLHLSLRDPTGAILVESTRVRDGNWKTKVDHDFPHSVDVESTSRSRLKALRRTLLGNSAAAKTGLVFFLSITLIIVLGVVAYLYRYVW